MSSSFKLHEPFDNSLIFIIIIIIFQIFFKSQAKLKMTPMTLFGFVFSAFLRRKKSSSDPHLFSLRIIFSATTHMRPWSLHSASNWNERSLQNFLLISHPLDCFVIIGFFFPAGLSCDFLCQSLVSLCPLSAPSPSQVAKFSSLFLHSKKSHPDLYFGHKRLLFAWSKERIQELRQGNNTTEINLVVAFLVYTGICGRCCTKNTSTGSKNHLSCTLLLLCSEMKMSQKNKNSIRISWHTALTVKTWAHFFHWWAHVAVSLITRGQDGFFQTPTPPTCSLLCWQILTIHPRYSLRSV